MPSPLVAILGSEKSNPPGKRLGEADRSEQVEVSIYIKDQSPEPGASRAASQSSRAQRLAPVMKELARFAEAHGLRVAQKDAARRLVKLTGPVDKLEAAFGTTLQQYDHNGYMFRARTGPLTLPSDLSDKIESVLGLDNRPAARPSL